VKGISQKVLAVQIFPNKPNLLVAPNGFGKSSIAAAFTSLRASKLEVADDHKHGLAQPHQPLLSITYIQEDGATAVLSADEARNDIRKNFGVSVINSRLKSKARTIPIGGGRSISTASIEVDEIVLIDKIVAKERIPYSYTDMRNAFGANGKVLPNLSTHIADVKLMSKVAAVDFAKQDQVRHSNAVTAFKAYVNGLNGSAEQILNAIEAQEIEKLAAIPHVEAIRRILVGSGYEFKNEAQIYVAAVQLADLYQLDRNAFKRMRKYAEYAVEKDACVAALRPFAATWKGIAPQEAKGRLVLKFPSAHQISNGERDTLCLVGALLTAERKLHGDCAILVIDEVFDYLDDANLIACQYYLTQMIERWKQSNRQLIPVILTHLDPSYFKNFTFKDQKVSYLARNGRNPDKKVHSVIQNRNKPNVVDALSKFFLHYHPESDEDLTLEFEALGLDITIATPATFKAYINGQLDRYLADKGYDPVSVCCAVRNLIEKSTYEMLDDVDRDVFIEKHTTGDKLEFAVDKGLELPNQFFLLAVIYNEAAHVRPNTDFLTPLYSKLDNLTIKRMIREIRELEAPNLAA
jgi:hypothetical protein